MDAIDFAAMEQEVQSRIERALADPTVAIRYDLNRDGVIDESEREELRRVILAEVFGEFTRRLVAPPSTPAERSIGRFTVHEEIGSGGQGHTYRAVDNDSGETVALKELAVGRVDDWKAIELFEREAAVLEKLSHPGIPHYIDAFHLDDVSGRRFFIVQTFVDGPALDTLLEREGTWSEERVRRMTTDILEILEYLHRLAPPVIHRDIKPANIIQRPDGSIALIDFGAVQNVVPKTVGGSTIAGTPGFMPIEQIMGRSVPQTDFYALGATILQLVTGTHPADFPIVRSKIVFDDHPDVPASLRPLLRTLLSPSVEDRPPDVEAVRNLLDSHEIQTLPAVESKDLYDIYLPEKKSTFLDASTQGVLAHSHEILDRIDADLPTSIARQTDNGVTQWLFQNHDLQITKSNGQTIVSNLESQNHTLTGIFAGVTVVVMLVALWSQTQLFVVFGSVSAALAFFFFVVETSSSHSLTIIPGREVQIGTGRDREIIIRDAIQCFETRSTGTESRITLVGKNQAERVIARRMDDLQATYVAALLNRELFER